MRKIIFLVLFFHFYYFAYNQIISGTVFDKKTNNIVPYATVYYNGTFVGTTSNEHGDFEIESSKNTSMPLTISAIGYYSVVLTNYSNSKPIQIYLVPKLFELKEVTVSDKSLVKKRRANLKIFKDEFLGTTANSQKCEILNENDITFNYATDDDTLKAYTSKPIIIDNKALGYKITYYLDKFEYYKRKESVFFYGNIIFNEDKTNEDAQMEEYQRKRRFAYLGSRMHFFRALWLNDLTSSQFNLSNSANQKLKYKDIVKQNEDGTKYLQYNTSIRIEYMLNYSLIVFRKQQVFFDQIGYFDPSGLNWIGEMGNMRIGDWLPYEYLPQ